MEKINKGNEKWSKHESKSRPGTFYYFNSQNGKTCWTRPPGWHEEASTSSKILSPTTRISSKLGKKLVTTTKKRASTPAQDRLTALRKTLAADLNSLQSVQNKTLTTGLTIKSPVAGILQKKSTENKFKHLFKDKKTKAIIKQSSSGSNSNRNFNVFTPKKKNIANERLQTLRKILSENAEAENRNTEIVGEAEYMDWETLDYSEKAGDSQTNNESSENDSKAVEIQNAINKCLQKKLDEKNFCIENYLENDVILVIDTNVLLHDLPFVAKILMGNPSRTNTDRIIIAVPYCVLQELDKLKNRDSEFLKTLTIRAIKFLNKHLEENHERLRGQSCLNSSEHLIEVDSNDDSIINFCLQIQEHTSNVFLISNDINLRNKALISDILTCTKNDFE